MLPRIVQFLREYAPLLRLTLAMLILCLAMSVAASVITRRNVRSYYLRELAAQEDRHREASDDQKRYAQAMAGLADAAFGDADATDKRLTETKKRLELAEKYTVEIGDENNRLKRLLEDGLPPADARFQINRGRARQLGEFPESERELLATAERAAVDQFHRTTGKFEAILSLAMGLEYAFYKFPDGYVAAGEMTYRKKGFNGDLMARWMFCYRQVPGGFDGELSPMQRTWVMHREPNRPARGDFALIEPMWLILMGRANSQKPN